MKGAAHATIANGAATTHAKYANGKPPVALRWIMASKELVAEFRDVSPEDARYILENLNPANRKSPAYHSDGLANDMALGHFHTTHQGIAFAQDGNLADGQNRLRGIVKSGKTQRLLVVRGLDRSAILAIDRGKKRTDADNIKMAYGLDVSSRDTAVAKAMVDGLRSRGAGARSQGSRALTGQSLLDFFNEHTDAIRFACQGGTAKGLTAACRAVVAKAFYREDHDRLREFLEILAGLKTPNGPEDSAADRLRTILLRSSRGQNIKGSQELAAQTTYALERFLRRLPTRAIIAATKDPWPLEEIG